MSEQNQTGAEQSESPMRSDFGFYDATYDSFHEELQQAIRQETFDEDLGQNGWLTGAEINHFLAWLALGEDDRLLDIACGSGGPALRICGSTGCSIVGVDIHEQGVANAHVHAARLGLDDRATFQVTDASAGLEFSDRSFDVVTCFDAINHLPHRARVLQEWRRVLRPGGLLLFTDPIVVSGAITNEEIQIRTSIGYFLLVPPGFDEELLADADFEVLQREDRTQNMADVAARWREARARREGDLRRIEGGAVFEQQQTFLEVTARLARERRLSRWALLARKPD